MQHTCWQSFNRKFGYLAFTNHIRQADAHYHTQARPTARGLHQSAFPPARVHGRFALEISSALPPPLPGAAATLSICPSPPLPPPPRLRVRLAGRRRQLSAPSSVSLSLEELELELRQK